MSAETVAYAALSAAAAVTTLVSTRIYPDFVPQEKTLPAVAINRAATEYITTIHSQHAARVDRDARGLVHGLDTRCRRGLADAVVADPRGRQVSRLTTGRRSSTPNPKFCRRDHGGFP
jgi:hypothetical protein